MKNAPHLKEPWNKQHLSDLIVLVGSDAWGKGESIAWRLVVDGLKINPFIKNSQRINPYDQSPIILGTDQLNEIANLRIADKEQTAIKFIQCGELTEAQKSALCVNIATNTNAQICALYDSLLDLVEDFSGYIARIRKGETMAEAVAESTASIDKRAPYIEKRAENGIAGLYYVTPKYNKETGELLSERAEWLSDAISVVGIGQSETEHFIVLEWTPESKQQPIIEALSLGDLGEREGWRQLKAKGLK